MKKQSKQITFAIAALGVLVWFGLSQGLEYLYRQYAVGETKTWFDSVILTMVIPYAIVLPVTYLILRTQPNGKRDVHKIGWKETIQTFVIQSGFSFPVMAVISSIIMAVTGKESGMDMEMMKSQIVFYLILLLVFNPIMEEVLFRKLVMDRLLPYGDKFAIVGSSILFALPHIYAQGIAGMCYVFVLALVWGSITVKSGSIKQAVILHSLSNLWGCFIPMLLMTNKIGIAVNAILHVMIMPVAAVCIYMSQKKKASQSTQQVKKDVI